MWAEKKKKKISTLFGPLMELHRHILSNYLSSVQLYNFATKEIIFKRFSLDSRGLAWGTNSAELLNMEQDKIYIQEIYKWYQNWETK